MTRVTELLSTEQMRAAWPVLSELRSHLDEEGFAEAIAEMREGGYRLFALEENGRTLAVAGIGIGRNLYYGRYLWVYDLVTTEAARSRGHGLELLRRLEEVARAEGCETIALSSALHRADAHRFYTDRAGYDKAGYTFTKDLTRPA